VKLFLILREEYRMSFRTEWQGEYLELIMVSTMQMEQTARCMRLKSIRKKKLCRINSII
jgi:hypothetical protein